MERTINKRIQASNAMFFSDTPELCLQDFYAFVARCMKDDVFTTVQPACCRELIFTETNILISPIIECPGRIVIISKKETIGSKKFKEKLQALEIEPEEKLDVTPALFQYCLVFTLTQRMAPLWNRIGTFLVQGKGFAEERNKLNAIRLDLKVSDKICFSVNAFQIKFPPCEIEDFSVSPNTVKRFRSACNSAIEDTSLENNRCTVIPSLEKAYITSITKHIPKSSPFQTYDELRKHWKLMYGYHLPSKSCGEYYTLRFFGEKEFIYPSYCVRSDEPVIFHRCDHDSIQAAFINDLTLRMPTACGISIIPNKTPLLQQVKLCTAIEEDTFVEVKPRKTEPLSKPFRIKTQAAQIRTVKDISESPESKNPSRLNDEKTLPLERKEKLIPSFTKRRISPLIGKGTAPEKKKAKIIDCRNGMGTLKDGKEQRIPLKPVEENIAITNDTAEPLLVADKKQAVVPFFKNSVKHRSASLLPSKKATKGKCKAIKKLVEKKQKHQQQNMKQPGNKAPKKVTKMALTKPVESQEVSEDKQLPRQQMNEDETAMVTLMPTTPSFQRQAIASDQNLGLQVDRLSQMAPKPVKNAQSFKKQAMENKQLSGQHTDCCSKTVTKDKPSFERQISGNKHSIAAGKRLETKLPERPRSAIAIDLASMILAGATNADATSAALNGQAGILEDTANPASDLKTSVENNCHNEKEPMKKPRRKPVVSENIDMKELAEKNELKKANIATLKSWLKSKGMAVKASMKKDELINMVKVYMNVNLTEE